MLFDSNVRVCGGRSGRWTSCVARICLAAGACVGLAAPMAMGEGPFIKVKVKVSSEEICVPSGPAYVKLRDGTVIYVPAGGMLYISRNDTEVETLIKQPDLKPFLPGILPAITGEGLSINERGSTTQMSFDIPGLTDGHEYTELTNITGWVSFKSTGCGGVVAAPRRVVPEPTESCRTVGLPPMSFHIDVPPMEFLGGRADTGWSTFTLDPDSVNVGTFSFKLDAQGRIVGTGEMKHDLLWDSPNYRMVDGSPDGGPVRFRETSRVTFTLETAFIFGDLDGNGTVDSGDLARLIAQWGMVSGPDERMDADLNLDGIVNADDLTMLLHAWGAGR